MLAAEDVQRQITVATVVPMKESPFVMTIQRVVGRIQDQPDLARCPAVRFHEQLELHLIECFRA